MRSIRWNTFGGGDLGFTVTLDAAGNLAAHLSRASFQARNESFTLAPATLPGGAYAVLRDLCAGRRAPRPAGARQPSNLPTGTWTTIYLLREGEEIELDDWEVEEAMGALREVVSGRI